jgi:hypothetical protein
LRWYLGVLSLQFLFPVACLLWDNVVGEFAGDVPHFSDLYGVVMSDPIDNTTVWHNDGHTMYLQLHRNELSILTVNCPGGEDRECQIDKFSCVVQWFLDRYGLDCNVGVSEVSSTMEIAWSVQGDTSDPDLCQVWVIPTKDEAFAAWLESQV